MDKDSVISTSWARIGTTWTRIGITQGLAPTCHSYQESNDVRAIARSSVLFFSEIEHIRSLCDPESIQLNHLKMMVTLGQDLHCQLQKQCDYVNTLITRLS